MTEIAASAATGAVVDNATGVLNRLLGPTADIMGGQLADWYRNKSVAGAVRNAAKKATGSAVGVVSPRVVGEVFEKIRWSDSEFLVEYMGGVLAASRSIDGTDDSGVSWASFVGRLSSDQIAMHWIIYSSAQRRSRMTHYEQVWEFLSEQLVYDVESILETLGWIRDDEELPHRFIDAIYGLKREGLISNLSHGPGIFFEKECSWTRGRKYDRSRYYFTCSLTEDGIAMLLQALGERESWFNAVFGKNVDLAIDNLSSLPLAPRMLYVGDYDLVED